MHASCIVLTVIEDEAGLPGRRLSLRLLVGEGRRGSRCTGETAATRPAFIYLRVARLLRKSYWMPLCRFFHRVEQGIPASWRRGCIFLVVKYFRRGNKYLYCTDVSHVVLDPPRERVFGQAVSWVGPSLNVTLTASNVLEDSRLFAKLELSRETDDQPRRNQEVVDVSQPEPGQPRGTYFAFGVFFS